MHNTGFSHTYKVAPLPSVWRILGTLAWIVVGAGVLIFLGGSIVNKRTLALLEKAYAQEINSALSGGLDIIQTKSKLAQKLCDDGLLEPVVRLVRGQSIPDTYFEGYALTHAGRIAYCAWAAEQED